MKESMGTLGVLNFILIFLVIFIGLYVTAISFSKGFKIRNRIIQIIEQYNGYESEDAQDEIYADLKNIGYKVRKKGCVPIDKHGKNKKEAINNDMGSYNYCIYKFDGEGENSKGDFYGVMVFVHFDLPIIGDYFEIPIYGETRLLYMKDRVEG